MLPYNWVILIWMQCTPLGSLSLSLFCQLVISGISVKFPLFQVNYEIKHVSQISQEIFFWWFSKHITQTIFVWTFAAGGIVGAICIALSLVYVGTVEDIGFHQTGSLVKWNGLPYSLGVFGFCYSGHSVLPNLYHSMSNKKKFHKALTIM